MSACFKERQSQRLQYLQHSFLYQYYTTDWDMGFLATELKIFGGWIFMSDGWSSDLHLFVPGVRAALLYFRQHIGSKIG